jgi:hypothetical protein
MFILKGIDYHATQSWMGPGIVGYLVVHTLLILGLGVGWALGFPRWSYAALGAVLIGSGWLAGVVTRGFRWFGYAFGSERWGWRGWLPLLVLILFMLALTRSLTPLRQLIQHSRRDWTLASFAIYAALSWLFLGVAYDGKTWYNETLYLPINLFLMTLALAGGAAVYMLGRRPWRRTLALPAALLLCVLISGVVAVFDGSTAFGLPATIEQQLSLLFAWALWISVPLWPGVVGLAWRRLHLL